MLNAYIFNCYTECAMLKVIMLSVNMLNVIMLSVDMLNVIMLSVGMMSVIKQSVIMLSVVVPIVMASVRVQCYKTFYCFILWTFLIT